MVTTVGNGRPSFTRPALYRWFSGLNQCYRVIVAKPSVHRHRADGAHIRRRAPIVHKPLSTETGSVGSTQYTGNGLYGSRRQSPRLNSDSESAAQRGHVGRESFCCPPIDAIFGQQSSERLIEGHHAGRPARENAIVHRFKLPEPNGAGDRRVIEHDLQRQLPF